MLSVIYTGDTGSRDSTTTLCISCRKPRKNRDEQCARIARPRRAGRTTGAFWDAGHSSNCSGANFRYELNKITQCGPLGRSAVEGSDTLESEAAGIAGAGASRVPSGSLTSSRRSAASISYHSSQMLRRPRRSYANETARSLRRSDKKKEKERERESR